ncbi:hypothetical protein GCM10022284_43280 [Streptomyces hundungensis]
MERAVRALDPELRVLRGPGAPREAGTDTLARAAEASPESQLAPLSVARSRIGHLAPWEGVLAGCHSPCSLYAASARYWASGAAVPQCCKQPRCHTAERHGVRCATVGLHLAGTPAHLPHWWKHVFLTNGASREQT